MRTERGRNHAMQRLDARAELADRRLLQQAMAVIKSDNANHAQQYPITDALTLKRTCQAVIVFPSGTKLVIDATREGVVTVLGKDHTPSLDNAKNWKFEDVQLLLSNVTSNGKQVVEDWRAARKLDRLERKKAQTDNT